MDRAKDSMVVNEFGSIREMSRTVSWKQLRGVGWVGRRKLRVGWFQ